MYSSETQGIAGVYGSECRGQSTLLALDLDLAGNEVVSQVEQIDDI